MEKYGFQCGNFRFHKTKPHLILPPPNLVRIIGILMVYFAEVLTYRRVVLGWQILQEDPTYQPYPGLRRLMNRSCHGYRNECRAEGWVGVRD